MKQSLFLLQRPSFKYAQHLMSGRGIGYSDPYLGI